MYKKEINIAVVANMSAGKSTFINAMFGDDILPSSSQATTDCPIYIYSDNEAENNMAIIDFNDNRESRGLSQNTLKKELKEYAKKDSLVKDTKYKNVKKIDLYWRFHSFVNKSKSSDYYVVVDTPGPNNSDEFGEQHFLTTQSIVLGHASKVIYLLDYKQIDANLEVTQNNLWGWIEKRKKIDSKFEVLFVINKIDEALYDNEKIQDVLNAKNEKEYILKVKKNWFFHEKKAIDKVENLAKKIGFINPIVMTISAEYLKLERIKKLSFYDVRKLKDFKEQFKNIFADSWREEYHRYIGSDIEIFNFSKNKKTKARNEKSAYSI
ncbi:MAG TPA: hypothetical protein EYG73_12860 [Arcobacter sp.]|nr:hypothetical protein [Arcobacter sp.]